MTFDFRLQVFHTVAKRLNFTRAAEELFISQPAVTRHIQELEQQFKVKLFERNGTRIRLSTAGQRLLQHTEELFAVYRNIEFDMSSLTRRHSGRLLLGGSMTAAPYIIPPILAQFHGRYPEVEVSLITGNTQQIEKALEQQEIDLGIVEGHSRPSSIHYTEFMKDEIVLVSNPSHPLAKKAVIRPEELTRIPLLLREPGSGSLEVVAHALKGIGIKLSAVEKELQRKECCIVEVKGLKIERKFHFARLQGDTQALPELFMKFALHYCKKPGL